MQHGTVSPDLQAMVDYALFMLLQYVTSKLRHLTVPLIVATPDEMKQMNVTSVVSTDGSGYLVGHLHPRRRRTARQ